MMCMMHGMNHSQHDAHAAQANTTPNEALLDILKRRYALGEITLAQFEEMKRALGLTEQVALARTAEHSHQ